LRDQVTAFIGRRQFITLLGGAVLTWPRAMNAEKAGSSYRISFLALVPEEDKTLMRALLERLHELGYREDTNMVFQYRSAEGNSERLVPLAVELVRDKPDVLVAGFGTLAAKAAKEATATIPVVFTTVGDPVGAGIVASLARPGGNVTGLTDQARDVQGKRLQLLLELVPDKQDIAALLNPDTPFSRLALEEAKAAAEHAHIRLHVLEVRTADQISEGFENARKAAAAGMLILEDPLIYSIRGQIAALAAGSRLPTIFVYKDSVEAGGLMSYGPERRHLYRRAAEYVDKILKGAKSADLPVEQPTKFELVINLKTAKTLGLDVPATLLARADEVIE
jgi:putative tryptophan/tyrosine transport system substrate-binding protein